jgi:hypothetical protein
VVAGAVCGRRWQRVEGGDGGGRLEAGCWPPGRSVWGAAEPERVGGEEEGAVGVSSAAGEKRREGEVSERGGLAGWGQLGLEGV